MSDLADGESVEVQGSAAKPYVLKNVGGVYSCTCPAWRNQSTALERRTCKHLRKLRGDAAELERIGGELPPKAISTSTDKEGPPLLLAQAWDNSTDLADWWMSEKLDGVRAYWDGQRFLSRLGNEYHAPEWFTAGLPNSPLDGELWIDRKKFQRTVSIVRRQDKSDHWREVRYLVFDAPDCSGGFEERLRFLKEGLRLEKMSHVLLHEHQRCQSIAHLQQELARVEALDGEGLMLRQPGSAYEVGRSSTLLKVKSFHDAEAVVLAHQPGKGKHTGKLGAVVVQLPDGTEFSVGTGFSDAERAAPPPIGSVITFRYQELSDGGVPRFPSFVRVFPQAAAGGTPSSSTSPSRAKKSTTSVAVAKTPPARGATAAPSSPTTRYFEFVGGNSQKFWEVSVADATMTVRYGRIGSQGTTKVTTFADARAATDQMRKLIDEKTAKGYVES